MNRAKQRYLLSSLRKQLTRQGLSCPSCGSTESTAVSHKYLVTELRRCGLCKLLFRAPTTTATENERFYQAEYSAGFTTDIPPPEVLAHWMATRFQGTEKDYMPYLRILAALGCQPGDSIFDFGCSWGYGSWQMAQAGFDVTAYEISLPRCDFARQMMNVRAQSGDPADITGEYDVFFSAHVLEHLPSVSEAVRLARRIVKPNGWFVAFTPNGSQQFRQRQPSAWQSSWGLVHPNLLDDQFYRISFASDYHLIASSPYPAEAIREWAAASPTHGRIGSTTLDLSGDELMVAARVQPCLQPDLAPDP